MAGGVSQETDCGVQRREKRRNDLDMNVKNEAEILGPPLEN